LKDRKGAIPFACGHFFSHGRMLHLAGEVSAAHNRTGLKILLDKRQPWRG